MRNTTFAMAVASGALAMGCSVPDYTFEAATDPAPIGDVSTAENGLEYDATRSDAGCKVSTECASSSATPHCNSAIGKCVQCLGSEHCAPGQWCSDGACVSGCRDDRDCAVPASGDAGVDSTIGDAEVAVTKCDPVAHVCVGCNADPDCPAGYLCKSDGVCRVGCTETHSCAAGNECCSGSCVDTTRDIAHCGACGAACPTPGNTTMGCAPDTSGKGACKIDSCAPSWGDCNGTVSDGCETTLNTLANCGGCGTACTIANGSGVCDGGTCKVAACNTGFGDCDGSAANGCEQSLNTLANCGGCATSCAPPNGLGDCSSGTCKVATCNSGYGDCDGADGNGCETNLGTNTSHCGFCGNACPKGSGTPACVSGVCKYSSCSTGFGDCTGDSSCSTELTANLNHCGACGNACVAARATPACTSGTCAIGSCNAGWGDCNGSFVDGCEQKLDTLANCGACGAACARANAFATCSTGACRVSACESSFANCDGVDFNGCESALLTDTNNCGACANKCTVANGSAKCAGGGCEVSACNSGYGDCNSSYGDGCEQKLDTLAHCGACGNVCTRSNATATCATGSCTIAACDADYGNCDGNDANGCEKSLLADVNNCGACGKVCGVTNGTGTCTGGACAVASCNAGYANCDSNPANCERNLASAANSCGSPLWLKDSSGNDICGYGSGDTVTTTTTSTKYYRVRLLRDSCGGTSCNSSSNPVRARFTVTSPPGVAYDLRIYAGGGCSTLVGSSTSGVLGGTETVTYNTAACSSENIYVEVKYRAGASCSAATLQVVGAYTPFP